MFRDKKRAADTLREDVMLSRLFGDAHKFDYENIGGILSAIYNKAGGSVELVRWDTGEELKGTLLNAIKTHLELDEQNLIGSFEEKAWGRVQNKYFNFDSSEMKIENWQIILPVNGHIFGVKEINKTIQLEYRKRTIDYLASQKWPVIPGPQGRDNFVYGDKVINLGNRSMNAKSVRKKRDDLSPLCYMANGEIGSVVGQYKGKKSPPGRPYVWIAFSSQPGYAYSFRQGEFDESERAYDFERAYCISVHKSQGSGFKVVFLVLPANNPLLSRELLYTAMTRQKDKIIILHQGDFGNYLRYAGAEYSETGRRLTDLLHVPSIREYEKKHYDSRYVNITLKGEPVISKSEALIANILYSYEQRGLLTYAYESKFTFQSGRTVKPDFLIEEPVTGRKFYWEHLGLLSSQDYRDKWLLKRQAYLDAGVVPAEQATIDDDVILITSEDLPMGGLNSQEVEEKLRQFVLTF
jgi:hypothetical protein